MKQLEDHIETIDGLLKLKADAIEKVIIKTVMSKNQIMGHQDYTERPTGYLVQLKGVPVKRRVYASPIGNNSVVYLKTKLGTVYCELALEEALARAEDD